MKVTDDTFNQFMKSANTKLDELSTKVDEIDMVSHYVSLPVSL